MDSGGLRRNKTSMNDLGSRPPFNRRRVTAALAVILVVAVAALANSSYLLCSLFDSACRDDANLQNPKSASCISDGSCNEEPSLQDEINCARRVFEQTPCLVEACFGFPAGAATPTPEALSLLKETRTAFGFPLDAAPPLTPEALSLLKEARAACLASATPQTKVTVAPERLSTSQIDANDKLYASIRACIEASPCATDACYEKYHGLFDVGEADRLSIERILADAKELCRAKASKPTPGLMDGEYSGVSSAVCGAAMQSVTVKIEGGRISWEHATPIAPGGSATKNRWTGVIDSHGNIRASIAGLASFSANGQYNNVHNKVFMRGPNCTSAIPLTIQGKKR